MKRAMLAAVAVAATLSLAACQTTGYQAGGANFATADEALAFTRQATSVTIQQIRPLPAPVAETITVVSPTREHAIAVLKAANTDPRYLDYLADAAMINWSLPAQQIERRGAFKKVIVKYADAPSISDIQPGGYLLWLEAPTRDQFFYHVAERGAKQTSRLDFRHFSGSSPEAQVTAVMEALERYVRDHPAQVI